VNAGVRLDHYSTDFSSVAACGGKSGPACGSLPTGTPLLSVDADKSGNLPNGQLGVVYKPVANGSIYANFATAEQPPGGDNLAFSASANSADNPLLNPQRARTTEVGTKWNLLDNQLLLTGALYSTTVTDLVAQDPVTLLYYQVGRERVQGIELTAVGKLSANWAVSAGFTTMNTSVAGGAVGNGSSASSPANDGSNVLAYTPKQSFTSWTTYHLPFGLTIGGGARYSGEMQRGTDSAIGTPDDAKAYWVFNGMASYPVNKHFDLQLNLYNIFNKSYVAAINKSGYRYIPGTPRSAMLTANFRF
jgi:catecholate siderophore receptor